jgi:uncharacterized protein YecT (DUF1311 family)
MYPRLGRGETAASRGERAGASRARRGGRRQGIPLARRLPVVGPRVGCHDARGEGDVMRALIGIGAGLTALLAVAARGEEPVEGDCAKRAQWSDMMVCGNPDLGARHAAVDRAYRKAQEGLSPQDAGEVRAMQDAWLKGRERCQQSGDPVKCLQDYYDGHVRTLVQPDADDD